MTFIKNFLFIFILLGTTVLLHKILVPVHFLPYETPYFSARFPGEPYHTVKSDYDLWDVSTQDNYYFVYVSKLDLNQDAGMAAEIAKQNFIKDIGDTSKIGNEEFSIPAKFKGGSYVSYVDEENIYWRFVYVAVPENNAMYQIGVSSKKDSIDDLVFFLGSFKVRSI